MELYTEKEINYHTGTRHDLIGLIPKNSKIKVLEIGAGGGDTLCYLKHTGIAKEVIGVELMKLEGSNQSSDLIDKFYFANIEEDKIELERDYFDVIILADVLEHLIDPWSVVDKVIKSLKPDGKMLVSLPNIREFNTMIKIFLLGDFKYKGDGVLDKTHLRFFCKKNMLQLLNQAGYKVERVFPGFKLRDDRKSRKRINFITLGLFEEFCAIQYLFEISRGN